MKKATTGTGDGCEKSPPVIRSPAHDEIECDLPLKKVPARCQGRNSDSSSADDGVAEFNPDSKLVLSWTVLVSAAAGGIDAFMMVDELDSFASGTVEEMEHGCMVSRKCQPCARW